MTPQAELIARLATRIHCARVTRPTTGVVFHPDAAAAVLDAVSIVTKAEGWATERARQTIVDQEQYEADMRELRALRKEKKERDG